jgi:para-aminobenzoate synthetase component 1
MTRSRAASRSGCSSAGRPTARLEDRPTYLERVPELDSLQPIDVADRLRDRPGLALLETARGGRRERWTYLSTDPLVVLDRPATGRDPFAEARSLLKRMASDPAPRLDVERGAEAGQPGLPPFLGGLVGYLAYDLGAALERLPHRVPDDQGLPILRLALHDVVIAWDRWTGRAWLGGRAVDGDARRLRQRLAWIRERALRPADREDRRGSTGVDHPGDAGSDLVFVSSMSRAAHRRAVEAVRSAIARGDIYQANLTRRLETAFAGDPWPLYRRLRTGDPAVLAAYLDVGPGPGDLAGSPRATRSASPRATPSATPRAILSASPEPFLSLMPDGVVTSDPIKGTRPRGRDRAEERALARELLASDKDRAENTMIVDVLRNDLGRVCRPGSVRVPRLCRLERTAAVQHLVSTVTGTLAPGRDAFDLLAASFPGGSITGAPKLRAIELLEDLEPVRRGPYTGALGWIGADGAMRTSILIRTFVADGRRLTLHVGGGITWRSDPAAEWDETVAKARGPLSAIGGMEAEVVGDAVGAQDSRAP